MEYLEKVIINGSERGFTDTGAARVSHTHSASNVTGGTFGGAVYANSSAVSSLGTGQMRNMTVGSTDLTAGTSSLASGALYLYYT